MLGGVGVKKIGGSSALQMNGQLTLEQMSLDRRDDFAGDAYDPFNYQQRTTLQNDGIQLQQSSNYMGINSTTGNKLWTPEQQRQMQAHNIQQPVTQEVAPRQQLMTRANQLDDLEEIEEIEGGDQAMPPQQPTKKLKVIKKVIPTPAAALTLDSVPALVVEPAKPEVTQVHALHPNDDIPEIATEEPTEPARD